MRYRCPYCRYTFDDPPRDARCPACRRFMRLPHVPSPRAIKRRKRDVIRMEAEKQRLELRHTPIGRAFRSPRVLFGFMLVMAVLGALLVRRAEPPKKAVKRIPHQVALQHLDTLATALGRYHFHVGAYPSSRQGLAALLNNPGEEGWDGPYINQLLLDPWGTPFQYECDGETIKLFTAGPDREPGTNDDLRPDPAAFDPGTDWTNGWVKAIYRQPGTLILKKIREMEPGTESR